MWLRRKLGTLLSGTRRGCLRHDVLLGSLGLLRPSVRWLGLLGRQGGEQLVQHDFGVHVPHEVGGLLAVVVLDAQVACEEALLLQLHNALGDGVGDGHDVGEAAVLSGRGWKTVQRLARSAQADNMKMAGVPT